MKSIKLIYTLIGATIVLILANSVFFFNQFYHNDRNYSSAKKAYRTIEYTNQLQSTLLKAEMAQSNFYITDDNRYLRAYQLASPRIQSTYKTLLSLENSHPIQLPRLKKLYQLINTRLTIIAEAVELQKSGQRDKAGKILKSVEGIAVNEDIKDIANEIKAEENNFLEASNAAIEHWSLRLQLFSIISNWILLVVVVSALITIIRNRQQIEALFSQIGKKNDLLEAQKNELELLSQNLMKQNTELERFAYVASHDLRSPAVNQTALLGLYDVAKTDDERAELIYNMKELAHSLTVKLDDLIEALRSNRNSKDLYENLSFEEVYHTVTATLSADILESKAHIECDFSEAPQIYSLKSYLESIVQNLLSNAIKYRHPDREPEIKLKTFKSGKHSCFKISDNGLGIDLEKNKDTIFGMYKTFHKDHDSKGIGLYITKAQVLALGGTIDVDSTPDVGTTFTICV